MHVETSGVRDSMGEVKDVDSAKRQVSVVVPWEVLDTYRTDFSRDCFDGYLSQRLPAMAWCHQKTEPIGAVISHQKGQRANEFIAEFSDFDAVPRSRQAFSQIEAGHLKDFSFTYAQAKAVPHPNERGAVRFTHANMPEISPVIAGSIPGAMATGVREAADSAGIAELVNSKVITAEEGRAMLLAAGGIPDIEPTRSAASVGTIEVSDDTMAAFRAMLDERLAGIEGQRNTEDDETAALAGAVDAALDQAADLMDGVDLSTRSAAEQQAWALVEAAGVASDALLDTMGVPDPDAPTQTDGGRSATQPTGDEPYETGERAAVYQYKHGWIKLDGADAGKYTVEEHPKSGQHSVLHDGKEVGYVTKSDDGTFDANHTSIPRLEGGSGQQYPTISTHATAVSAVNEVIHRHRQLAPTRDAGESLGQEASGSGGAGSESRSADDGDDVEALAAEAAARLGLLGTRLAS